MDHIPPAEVAQDRLRPALARLLPELRAFARFLAGSRAEADDLVQEALLRTLRAAEQGRFDGATEPPALRPWCLSVIRNVFHEQRRARRREVRHIEAGVLAATLPAARAPQEAPGEIRDLVRALAGLSPLLREALVLVGAQGLAYEEAAAICGVPLGTMKARVARARRELAAIRQRAAED